MSLEIQQLEQSIKSQRQEAQAYQQELLTLGYSAAQAHAMISALSAARHVIEIKHE